MSGSFIAVQFPPPALMGSSDRDGQRPQAGPLPMKRGEIGFVEGFHSLTNKHDGESAVSIPPLPARHPADRDYQSPSPPSRHSSSQSPQVVNETRTVDESTSRVTKGLFRRLKPKKAVSVAGHQLTSLLLFAIQLSALGGTIALWVYTTSRTKDNWASSQYRDSMGSLKVFIHVVFVLILVAQLVLLERRIYRLRRQRYRHLHGQALPRHSRSASTTGSIIAAAPWNRPPLPTYATVLAQSGAGTGDVEDNLIAIPPPPAYGNVRGSRLISSSRNHDHDG